MSCREGRADPEMRSAKRTTLCRALQSWFAVPFHNAMTLTQHNGNKPQHNKINTTQRKQPATQRKQATTQWKTSRNTIKFAQDNKKTGCNTTKLTQHKGNKPQHNDINTTQFVDFVVLYRFRCAVHYWTTIIFCKYSRLLFIRLCR